MFVLAELEYIIRVEPRRFGKDMKREVRDELNRKFANKVLHNVGLCIALYDITRVGDSYILPGDGASHTKVRFRVVVFRPFVDEILLGKIRSCSSEGVRVSLGFFDDVFIPHQSLQHPKRFDQEEQLWVWQYESEGQTHDMFMDLEEEMRFRVVQETFVDTIPKDVQPHSGAEGRGEGVGGAPGSSTGAALTATTDTGPQQAPYTIIGSMSESGLGLLSWWTG